MGRLNVKPRTIFCRDNLDVLRGINSECIDLIYLDPPFNKNKVFTAPLGSSAEGAAFKDIFSEEDVKDEWVKTIEQDDPKLHSLLAGIKSFSTKYNYCYCVYMAIRLIEMGRVLKKTGSVYLHCDQTMAHYLKLVLDCIFGEENFRNEVIWYYKNASRGKKKFANAHDIVFWFSKSNKYLFNRDDILQEFESGMTKWRYTRGGQAGKDIPKGKTPDDVLVMPSLNAMSKERTGYPTQKPLELLKRIVRASSNKGDMVLDPFCGCATTCIAAEAEQRQWVGIDVSYKAYELVKMRLKKDIKSELWGGEPNFTTELPKRGKTGNGRNKKYVYVISHPKYSNEYKVGVAKDLESRLASYQIADPERAYKIEYSKETPYYNEIEKYIHQEFDNKREWVSGDVNDIRKAIERWSPKQRELDYD